MTRVAIIGARDHRALAQVWRLVREFPADTTLVLPPDGPVADVAAIAARQRGLAVETHAIAYLANVDRVMVFPWDGDPAFTGAMVAAHSAFVAHRGSGIDWVEHAPDVGAEGLLVFSAQVAFRGPGRLQIPRRSDGCDPMGLPFAPSEALLDRALAARGQAEKLREAAAELRGRQLDLGETRGDVEAREQHAAVLAGEAERVDAQWFAWFRAHFLAEMRVSYGIARGTPAWTRLPPEGRAMAEEAWERGARPHPEAWRRLLAKGHVTICCFCTREDRCHRGILRAEILPALGAVDGGEVAWR